MGREHGREEAGGTGCGQEQEACIAKEGPLFSFFPFVQGCLPYSLPINYYDYNLFSHIALSSCVPVVSFLCLLLFVVWSLVLVELSSGNWDYHRLFPHSTSYPPHRLPGEGGSYPTSYSLCKTDVETVFWLLYFPCPKQKFIFLWRERKNWKPWSSLFEQLVRKKMVMSCLLPPQCQVVFMEEHETDEATSSLSMKQYKEVMQCVGSQHRTTCKGWTNSVPLS